MIGSGNTITALFYLRPLLIRHDIAASVIGLPTGSILGLPRGEDEWTDIIPIFQRSKKFLFTH